VINDKEIKIVDEVGYISREQVEKNWKRWAKMGREKTGIIKELDDWLNDSESREKEIDLDNILLLFNRSSRKHIIEISVVKYEGEIMNINYYINNKTPSAADVFDHVVLSLYSNAKYMQASADEISITLEHIKKSTGCNK